MTLFSMVDSHWIDTCAIIFGFMGIMIKPTLRKINNRPQVFRSQDMIFDFGNGAAVFLAVLMILSAFSSVMLKELVSASKFTLALSGLACLVVFCKEMLKTEN
jgi:hypothetical protein